MTVNTRELILDAARRTAQAHGYGGLNFRDLAAEVGIKAASIHYYFPAKAELGAAVARRYWEDAAAALDVLSDQTQDPLESLRRYPNMFRKALENDNRMCLGSFMAAEYDDLPAPIKKEVQAFADVNIAWLSRQLAAATLAASEVNEQKARAIFAAIVGAQLLSRSRADISVYDSVINIYRTVGLLPE
ncbi:TetR/AcrR family transcriptional regulator [Sphingobium sp. CR2-8]|uniref:TetR/AcrR family transcriptional regulator n=1 Tax=Sphingobium sp. CR2-8 TaxID=1306534 RepID=UPI002DB5981A|nr:TetR/AcrR family transcriptional regulator [Sphingobium sp. CR2-8]MEC3909487.1 TetR/AcrR family transcriptional regulator [Sphingobium sp. CR2-8]